MPAPEAGAPAPADPPFGFVLREDAERLLARRLCALDRVLDQLEDEGVAAIAKAVSGGDEAGIADANPELVKSAFLAFTADFAKRLEEVAAIPEAELAEAAERARRTVARGRRRRG